MIMCDMIMAYVYKPLPDASKDIRLIKILPSPTIIRCCTHFCRLSELKSRDLPSSYTTRFMKQPTLSYCALSYEWGSPDEVKSIELDGCEVKVRLNLFQFFNRMLQNHQDVVQDDGLYFWIDAISIDQGNPIEKAKQVQNMVSIFASAKFVLMWVGNHPAIDLPAAERLLCNIETLVYRIEDQSQQVSNQESAIEVAASEIDFWDSSAVTSLLHMTDLTCWTRRWIMQEVYLARSLIVLCNEHTIDLELFQTFKGHTAPALLALLTQPKMYRRFSESRIPLSDIRNLS